MKKLSLFIILAILLVVGVKVTNAQDSALNPACPMEIKQCPDGTPLIKKGPNCEFPACPVTNTTNTTNTNNTGGLLPSPKADNSANVQKDAIKKQIEAEKEKTRQEIVIKREALQTQMDALKESIKKEKDATNAKAAETRITGRENALTRFDKMVSTMTNLKDKVKTELSGLGTNGVDITGAEVFIASIETRLNDVRQKVVEIASLLSTSTNELTAADKLTLQNLTKDIQSIIDEIKDALNNAVKSLKDSVVNQK